MPELYGPGGYTGAGYIAVEEPEPETPATPSEFPDLQILIDFEQPGSRGATPNWTDCTEFLLQGSLSIKRGRQRELDRVEAGDLQLAFYDELGAFDPDTQGTLAGKVQPSLRIRVVALCTPAVLRDPWVQGLSVNGGLDVHGGGQTQLPVAIFDGVIEDWDYVYPGRGRTSFVNLRAVDWLGPLQRTEFTWQVATILQDPVGNQGDTLDEAAYGVYAVNKIRSILSRAPFGDTKTDIREDLPGQPDYPRSATTAQFDYVNAPMLTSIQDVAGVDGGNFFASRDGTLRYIGPEINDAPVGPNLTITPSVHPYTDVTFAYDENVIYNDVEVSGPNIGTSTASSVTSIDRYFRRPLSISLPFYDTQVMTARAKSLLERYSIPHRTVQQLVMDGCIADYPTILGLDLWDKCSASVRLPNGQQLNQTSLVEGIEIDSPSRQQWKVNLWLSEAPFPPVLDDDQATTFETGIGGWESAQANTALAWSPQIMYETWSERQGQVLTHFGGVPGPPGSGYFLSIQRTTEGEPPDETVLARTLPWEIQPNWTYQLDLSMCLWGTTEDVADNDPMPQARMEFAWYDASDVELSRTVGAYVDLWPSGTGISTAPTLYYSMTGKAPSAAHGVRVYARCTRVPVRLVADGLDTTIEDRNEVNRGLLLDDLYMRRI